MFALELFRTNKPASSIYTTTTKKEEQTMKYLLLSCLIILAASCKQPQRIVEKIVTVPKSSIAYSTTFVNDTVIIITNDTIRAKITIRDTTIEHTRASSLQAEIETLPLTIRTIDTIYSGISQKKYDKLEAELNQTKETNKTYKIVTLSLIGGVVLIIATKKMMK